MKPFHVKLWKLVVAFSPEALPGPFVSIGEVCKYADGFWPWAPAIVVRLTPWRKDSDGPAIGFGWAA